MNGSAESQDCDLLAVKEPLEIRECEKNRPKMSANLGLHAVAPGNLR